MIARGSLGRDGVLTAAHRAVLGPDGIEQYEHARPRFAHPTDAYWVALGWVRRTVA